MGKVFHADGTCKCHTGPLRCWRRPHSAVPVKTCLSVTRTVATAQVCSRHRSFPALWQHLKHIIFDHKRGRLDVLSAPGRRFSLKYQDVEKVKFNELECKHGDGGQTDWRVIKLILDAQTGKWDLAVCPEEDLSLSHTHRHKQTHTFLPPTRPPFHCVNGVSVGKMSRLTSGSVCLMKNGFDGNPTQPPGHTHTHWTAKAAHLQFKSSPQTVLWFIHHLSDMMFGARVHVATETLPQ